MTFPLVPGGPEASRKGLSNSMRPLIWMASDGRAMAVSSSRSGHSTPSAGSCDDAGEVLCLERRAAHQRAVDVGLGQELGGVLGLDRAAVLDPHGFGCRRAGPPAHEPADLPVHLLGLGGGRG